MNSRERVRKAVQHQNPDRVPLFYRDIPEVEQRLCHELGLPDREALLRFLDIDFRWIEPVYKGPSLTEKDSNRRRDIWGVEYKFTQVGYRSGYWEIVSCPLANVNDPAAMKDYSWPKIEWFDFSAIERQLNDYKDYAVMTGSGHASPGLLTTLQSLLGMERLFMDMMLNQDFLDALIERVVEFYVKFIDRFFAAGNGGIDFLRLGDDYGSQNGLLFGVKQWQRFIQQGVKAMSEAAKKHGAFYYHHSCGGVRELIPLLIESGADVLDPLQVKAHGMVPYELKAQFENRLCFSGGVDEQELLPKADPSQIRDAVFSLLDDMALGGGFFIGPTHNFQSDIPTANIVEMYAAAKEWQCR